MESLFSTEKIKNLLPQIKSFVERELYPLETSENLIRNFSFIEPILLQKRQLVKEAGLWGLHLSAEDGGLDLSLCEFGQISEIGRAHV